jgi:hypothetical protein
VGRVNRLRWLPGPDRETYFSGTASLGDRTVALGTQAVGPMIAGLVSDPGSTNDEAAVDG